MKKTCKGFILGVVVTLLFSTTTAIFADDLFEQIAVLRNPSKITINGEALNGDHFEFLDRTYVPLREISDRLGMDVTWNGEDNTINIVPAVKKLVVNGEVIDDAMYKAANLQIAAYYKNQGQSLTPEQLEEEAHLYLTERYLVCQEAKKAGISLTEEEKNEFKEQISAIATAMGKETYLKEISALGYTEETYEELQLQFMLIDKFKKTLGFKAEEADIRAYYEKNLAATEQEYMVAKHILFSTEGKTNAEKEEIRKKADAVLRRILNGADFDSLMKEYSQDPGLEDYPDGYTFTAGQMVAEFENAAKNLKNNQVSGLVETAYGYHIIKKVSSGVTDSYERLKSDIEAKLINDQYMVYVDSLRKSATIEWSK